MEASLCVLTSSGKTKIHKKFQEKTGMWACKEDQESCVQLSLNKFCSSMNQEEEILVHCAVLGMQ